jgi:hypothetical protein
MPWKGFHGDLNQKVGLYSSSSCKRLQNGVFFYAKRVKIEKFTVSYMTCFPGPWAVADCCRFQQKG